MAHQVRYGGRGSRNAGSDLDVERFGAFLGRFGYHRECFGFFN